MFCVVVSARIIYGLILVLICCFGVYRLLIASNKMNDERISHIQLLFKPDKAALLHFKGTPEDAEKWREQINKFLARKLYSRDDNNKL